MNNGLTKENVEASMSKLCSDDSHGTSSDTPDLMNSVEGSQASE